MNKLVNPNLIPNHLINKEKMLKNKLIREKRQKNKQNRRDLEIYNLLNSMISRYIAGVFVSKTNVDLRSLIFHGYVEYSSINGGNKFLNWTVNEKGLKYIKEYKEKYNV